jgi:hypothetical protein
LIAEKAKHIDYGYAVENAQRAAVDRVLVTGDASRFAKQQEALTRLSPHIRDLALYTSDSRGIAVQQAIPNIEIAPLSQNELTLSMNNISAPSMPEIELEGFGIGL